MRVVLLQDIENLGKKYEIKNVANGYARNFLIPNNMVKLADKQVLIWLETQKEIEKNQITKELKETQELATMIDGQEVIIAVKVGEEEQLFESITVQKISEKLKELGFAVEKNQIKLAEPIKELGEFPIKIHFKHNLETEIRVIIINEKND
ncbi:MAG: 50S ribosomal protein L9 [Candidatus Nealsonbacteria bacterium]|nr:50S ribosomal protein L9 [Candidatus Nealsonbacteria bacterium]